MSHYITINGLEVEVVRKAIKNLHLGVYPPHGRVRVAAPLALSDEAIRLAVIDKLGWIKRRQAKFEAQPRQSEREMVNGETHYFQGSAYRLRIVEHKGTAKIVVTNNAFLDLHVRPGTSPEQRRKILSDWYRAELKKMIPPLLEKWQTALKVEAAEWNIKKMKTKWGTCNPDSGRIWLNLELAKHSVHCLEYILVHELVHLLERQHNDHFRALMDEFMPNWRRVRESLNAGMLGFETWDY